MFFDIDRIVGRAQAGRAAGVEMLPPFNPAGNGSASPLQRPGEILVQFAPGASAAARQAAASTIGGAVAETVRNAVGEGMLARVTVGHGLSVEKAIEIISKRPGVALAEPDQVYTIALASNDPAYSGGQLWGMYGDRTSPTNAFGSQAGEAWAAGQVGSTKAVIGVVDSGVDYTHPDLYLNIWINEAEIPTAIRSALTDADRDGQITFRDLNAAVNASLISDWNGNGRIDGGDLLHASSGWEDGLDTDRNGYADDLIGWDFVNNDNDPYDDNNHGTHVAGTIAGVGGNGIGVSGVAWAAQIVALKFLSATGSGSTSGAIKAIDYYTNAAAVASSLATGEIFAATNNSWGGGGFSQLLLDAIVRGARREILFVAAAGNGGSDGVGDDNDSLPNYPSSYSTVSGAGYEAVISVASITSSGARSAFSNFGNLSVDLGAPGSSIYSTVPGGYATYSGTSMATPHVTGAIALYAGVGGASAATIRADLLGSAIPTLSLQGVTVSGGRLDAWAFVERALAASEPPPPPQTGPVLIYGTSGSDTIVGTTGNDKIWGVPKEGSHIGRGTIDRLTGNGGDDIFVLGDSRGRFYDDGKSNNSGTADYAHIRDFGTGDRIQLAGSLSSYFQVSRTLDGASGIGLYHDGNGNKRLDSRDELIAFVQGALEPLDASAFLIV